MSEIFRQSGLVVGLTVESTDNDSLIFVAPVAELHAGEVERLEDAIRAWRRKGLPDDVNRPHGSWVVVSYPQAIKDVRYSDGLFVTREWHAPREIPKGHIWILTGKDRGKALGPEHVMPGGPWDYREDARKAKAAFIIEEKIQKVTAAEVWGWEPEYHGF